MFDSEKPEAYEEVYQGLVERLAATDLAASAGPLGLALADGAVAVTLLGRGYLIGAAGVRAADGEGVPVAHRIVLAYLLLHGGRDDPAGEFIPYRELPGGADFARNLAVTVEGRLAEHFSGRAAELRRAAEALGGQGTDPGTNRFDAAYEFAALPGLPLRLTFYDADEEFPAEAKLFYDARADAVLDLECLAVLGLLLVIELERVDERRDQDRDRPG